MMHVSQSEMCENDDLYIMRIWLDSAEGFHSRWHSSVSKLGPSYLQKYGVSKWHFSAGYHIYIYFIHAD